MTDGEMWVFGYGSLIWNPEFPVAERVLAILQDYHRSFCMTSIHHRGTETDPGLVLALDAVPGASCEGVAFRVADGAEADTLAALRERELVSSAYVERRVPLALTDGRTVTALAYVIERDHRNTAAAWRWKNRRRSSRARSGAGGRTPNTCSTPPTTLRRWESPMPNWRGWPSGCAG